MGIGRKWVSEWYEGRNRVRAEADLYYGWLGNTRDCSNYVTQS